MKKLLTGIVAAAALVLLPALAEAGHDRSRSRSGVHFSIGAGVHFQSGTRFREPVVRHHAPVVRHHVAPRRVIVHHQPHRVHYLPAHRPAQVVVVQPAPVHCPPPVYHYHPPVTHYHQQTVYYYGR